MAGYITCADCRFARQDMEASQYTKKHCKGCEKRDGCEICCGCPERDACKARTNPKLSQSCGRRFETRCSMQALKWAAIECGYPCSDYYRALLNVTPGGDTRERVTWGGCPCGERGDRP
jgi:hypothetical protein